MTSFLANNSKQRQWLQHSVSVISAGRPHNGKLSSWKCQSVINYNTDPKTLLHTPWKAMQRITSGLTIKVPLLIVLYMWSFFPFSWVLAFLQRCSIVKKMKSTTLCNFWDSNECICSPYIKFNISVCTWIRQLLTLHLRANWDIVAETATFHANYTYIWFWH